MVFVMVGVGTVRAGGSEDSLRNLGLVALFVIVPLTILTVRQVRRGAWANADASRPHERPLLYAVGIAGTGALVFCLTVWLPDPALLRGSRVALPCSPTSSRPD